ncbi:MAG: hypothetical protein AB1765_03210 [Candidatus Hydrogenedentota bacterium]
MNNIGTAISNEIFKLIKDTNISSPQLAEKNLISIVNKEEYVPYFLEIIDVLISGLKSAGDPDRVLCSLERFFCNANDHIYLFRKFIEEPHLLKKLVVLIDNSIFLSEYLIKYPMLFFEYTKKNIFTDKISVDYLNADFEKIEKSGIFLKDLICFHHNTLFHIIYRHLILGISLQEYTEELSELAGFVINRVYNQSLQDLINTYGTPSNNSQLIIIGVGKLGGMELNYSSDIDLIFFYTEDGYTETETQLKQLTNNEFFSRLTDTIIKTLGAKTEDGWLYRVDIRLRPDGETGPLCLGLDAALTYYSTRSAFFEKQAMTKARVIAGDFNKGNEFLVGIKKLFFPRHGEDTILNDIYTMKSKINAELGNITELTFNVKLGYGGIREIEFIVQALLILNLGSFPHILNINTLQSLTNLRDARIISNVEFELLFNSYIFLRELEHSLQLLSFRQTHTLPVDERTLEQIAKRLGYKNFKDLLNRFMKTTEMVHQLYTDKIKIPASLQSDLKLLLENIDIIKKKNILERYKLFDYKKALQDLYYIQYGHKKSPIYEVSTEKFIGFLPSLLSSVSTKFNPSFTLSAIEQIFNNFTAKGMLFDLLSKNEFLMYLFSEIASKSEMLSSYLVKYPALFDILVDFDELFKSVNDESFDDTVHTHLLNYKIEKHFKTGVQYILGINNVSSTLLNYTKIADNILSVLTRYFYSKEESGYFLASLGKLGSCELGIASDLDLLFIHNDEISEPLTKATKLLNFLSESTPSGKLYRVDARLRPEGEKSPISIHINHCLQYYLDRARDWEKLAMTRLRYISGDKKLFGLFQSKVSEFVYGSTPPPPSNILEMKKNIEISHKDKNDFKHNEGGLMEIEMLLQLINIHLGKIDTNVRYAPPLITLENSVTHEIISLQESFTIREAYILYRSIETGLNLIGLQKTNIFPTNKEILTKLYYTLQDNMKFAINQNEFLNYMATIRAKIRKIFNSIIYRLSPQS